MPVLGAHNPDTLSAITERVSAMYFRSIYPGQCYQLDSVPRFGGFELITKEEYIAWCNANGFVKEIDQ